MLLHTRQTVFMSGGTCLVYLSLLRCKGSCLLSVAFTEPQSTCGLRTVTDVTCRAVVRASAAVSVGQVQSEQP